VIFKIAFFKKKTLILNLNKLNSISFSWSDKP